MARLFARIFGFRIFVGDENNALERIFYDAANHTYQHIIFVNSLRLLKGRISKKFAPVLNKATLLLPEGRGIRWASKRLQISPTEIFSCIDFFMNIIRESIKKKQTLFFLGSNPDILIAAIKNLRKSFPELRIVGSHHGFFTPERNKDIVQAIRKFNPDYLFVGTGFPRQEIWIQKNKQYFPDTTCMGVGNSFDLCAGIKSRGPDYLKKKGLSGVYKASRNPLRFFRIFKYPFFIFYIFWDKLFKKKGK